MNYHIDKNDSSQKQERLQRNIMKISEHQLGTKFRSKQDIYQYMTEVLHLYLPPKESINKDFFQQILKEDKKVLPMDNVKFVKVPRYEELSIKNLYSQALEDEKLKQYFPDVKQKNKPVPREFFFNILNSLYPEYLNELISHSQHQRSQPELNEQKKEYILISDEWYDKLMSQPFISKKPGKTLQLLKASSKILKSRKERVRPELSISLKRFKGMSSNSNIFLQDKENIDNQQISDDYGEQESNENTQLFVKKNIFNI